ncbi:hypothetical protein ARMSODRAFT_442050 [Armillaria solidipes]|uniref:Uncharacterized protein n=1 Tax=Armillaria solidipes TaxID=1076256 RepID=A0A2H3BQJ6_9AGAR|nr:hypothetical protein ARMSODRAFT_442050 [Armillaria solidipes]
MKDARCITNRLCRVQLLTFQRITFSSAVGPHVFMLMQLGLPERADDETINTWSPCRRQAALPLLLRSCKNSPSRIILTSIPQTAEFSYSHSTAHYTVFDPSSCGSLPRSSLRTLSLSDETANLFPSACKMSRSNSCDGYSAALRSLAHI